MYLKFQAKLWPFIIGIPHRLRPPRVLDKKLPRRSAWPVEDADLTANRWGNGCLKATFEDADHAIAVHARDCLRPFPRCGARAGRQVHGLASDPSDEPEFRRRL